MNRPTARSDVERHVTIFCVADLMPWASMNGDSRRICFFFDLLITKVGHGHGTRGYK
jgi:hypothetical protein